MICACVVAQAFAGGPAPSSAEPQQTASQSPPAASADATAQSAAPQSSSAATTASDKPSTDQKSSTSQASTTTSATPTKVVLVDKTLTDGQVKQLLARGYKPQSHGDDVLYCRREQQLGSHFETKICKTAAQIQRDELDSKETMQNMQRLTPGMAPGK
jgi:hypothetical protein